ncbi:uncharacterized protein LOC125315846 [Rhodamnia argentea]|uniref:Uncharacterized protein LOC125315846 n=1 Tax=Rhodamnia argentea TaxID=178133 RepID=A0ABM3HMG7_9MYRT|nr:uncharacterized protein LOC125315846 [Rhodamnia argentea]
MHQLLPQGKYYIRHIDHTNYTIRVADVGMRKGNCSSLPRRSLWCGNFSYHDPYSACDYESSMFYGQEPSKTVLIVKCTKAVASRLYIDASSCLDGVKFSNFSRTRRRIYAMVDANVSNVETACTIELMAMIPGWVDGNNPRSDAQIHEQMVYGFELSWLPIAGMMYCKRHYYWEISSKHQIQCGPKKGKVIVNYLFIIGWSLMEMIPLYGIVPFIVVKFIVGAPCVMLLLIRKWRRRHLAMDQNVEEFLQSNNNFLPIWYSYSDIKKITGGLKDKLGEGGYGSVFKGRLRSGHEVAVKILKKGNANKHVDT